MLLVMQISAHPRVLSRSATPAPVSSRPVSGEEVECRQRAAACGGAPLLLNRTDDLSNDSKVVHRALCRHCNEATVITSTGTIVAFI